MTPRHLTARLAGFAACALLALCGTARAYTVPPACGISATSLRVPGGAPAPLPPFTPSTPDRFVPNLPTPPDPNTAQTLMVASGLQHFPYIEQRALNTFYQAADRYVRGDYVGAKTLIDAVWAEFPSPQQWLYSGAQGAVDPRFQPDSPAGAHPLRVLSEIVNWQVARQRGLTEPTAETREFTVNVVMFDNAYGNVPQTLDDLRPGRGVRREFHLDPRLTADDHALLRQLGWLFGEYLYACSNAHLRVVFRPVHVAAPVELGYALLGPGWASASPKAGYMDLVPRAVLDDADGWLITYPAGYPRTPTFANLYWTGGGGGPMGPQGFGIMGDDQWFAWAASGATVDLTTPRSPMGLTINLSEWLFHEFFHNVFNLYFPEYGLERLGHDWFDPANVPKDFAPLNAEVDYFTQAIRLRITAADNGDTALLRRLLRHVITPAELPAYDPRALAGTWTQYAGGQPRTRATYEVVAPTHPATVRLHYHAVVLADGYYADYYLEAPIDAAGHLTSAKLRVDAPGEIYHVLNFPIDAAGRYGAAPDAYTEGYAHSVFVR